MSVKYKHNLFALMLYNIYISVSPCAMYGYFYNILPHSTLSLMDKNFQGHFCGDASELPGEQMQLQDLIQIIQIL